jgi:hypothetical protein
MATTESINLAQQMYVAYYGRPADQEGLDFWAAAFDATDDLDAALTAFGDSAEYTAAFSLFNSTGLITNLYQQMFGVTPDAEGLAFYLDRLETGVATLASIAKQIADGAQGDDLTALTNKVAVAADFTTAVTAAGAVYDATVIEDAQDLLADVDATDASVTASAAAITTLVDDSAAPFVLSEGLAALTAANAAVVAFNTANPDVATDLTTAVTAYEAAVTGSTVATDTATAAAALLTAQQATNATALTIAQDDLAVANTAITATAGLTAAVAADTAADAASTAATAAAAISQTALDVADASWDINSLVDAKIDASNVAGGVLTVTVDDGTNTPFTDNTVLTLTTVTNGVAAMAAANGAWTADQVTFFEAQQATAADLVAAFNADATADLAATAATAAAVATAYTVDFLDLDPTAADELAAVGGGFTLTTVATAATPTEAEIAAEVAGLAAAEAAAVIVAAGTEVARLAAVATDATSDTAVTAAATALATAVTNADVAETDGGTGATIGTGTIVVAADGTIQATLEGVAAQPVVVLNGDGVTLEYAAGVVADAGVLDALLAATIAKEAADATKVTTAAAETAATTADATADTAVTTATTAETAFTTTLVGAFDTANVTMPLTGVLAGLETAVTTAETAVAAVDAAVAGLAEANVLADELTALNATVTAAGTAIAAAGFATPQAIDAASEFATSADDIFTAGTTDSSVYSFGLIGDDTLYIGTANTHNTTLIGSGTDETDLVDAGDVLALEVFLVTNGADVDVIIETENYGSETGDYTTIKLVGADLEDVTLADGFITVA